MLKKECCDVFKQIVFFTLVILLLPAALIITTIIPNQSYLSVFFPIFQFGLFFWALFMGASLLSVDRGQRGMEYLLSLPYSRLQLIGIKIFPRVIAVLIFFIVFLIIYISGGEDVSAVTFLLFTAIYFSLFLISLSLSANSDNFVVVSAVSLFSLYIYFELLFLVYWVALKIKDVPYYELNFSPAFTGEIDLELIGLILPPALIFLLPLLASFFLSFKKFDIRPAKVYNKRYFKFFAPLLPLCFIISLLFAYQGIDFGYGSYYLTQDHKLIVSGHYSDIKIYERDKVYKIKGEFNFYWPFLEENEYVYDRSFRKIIRLNTSNYTVEVLYEEPSEKRTLGWQIWKYDQTIAFIEKNRDYSDIQLVLFDEASNDLTRIPFDCEPLINYVNPIIFGTDIRGGKRFWLICSLRAQLNPILRLWEDGRTENIGESQKRPFFVNQMLFTSTGDELIISKEKEGRFETIRKIPNSEGYHFGTGYFRANLNNIPLKKVYGWKAGLKYARLNLENFEIEEIGESKGYLHCFYPEGCYLVETDHIASTIKVYEYKEGKLKLIKNFKDYDTRKFENRFSIFKNGIVIKEGKKVKVYAFPDLKEIKFKKL